MESLLVLAAAGRLVPKEDKPRDYISETPPAGGAGHVVPASAYYLRRIADGDLVEVDGAGPLAPKRKA